MNQQIKIIFFIFYLFIFKFSFASVDQHFALVRAHTFPDCEFKHFLDKAFLNSKDITDVLEKSGFIFIKKITDIFDNDYHGNKPTPQLIAYHPNFPEYIVKALPDVTRGFKKFFHPYTYLRMIWKDRNIKRIKNANRLYEYVSKNNYSDFISVPKKWFYHIPYRPFEVIDENYFVIAQRLCLQECKAFKFSQKQKEILKELIEKGLLWDPGSKNQCLGTDGKIKPIDTESAMKIFSRIPFIKSFTFIRNYLKKRMIKKSLEKFENESEMV